MAYGMTRPEDADWREREKSRTKAMKSKTVREVTVRKGANGGHIVRHEYDNSGDGPYKPSEEYPFEDGKAMLAHVAKHMGVKMDSDND